jgi:hypothetical protein
MKPTENMKRKKERKNKEKKKNKALLNPLTKVSQTSIPTHSFLTIHYPYYAIQFYGIKII